MTQMVTIPKKEYDRLKRIEDETAFLKAFDESKDDVKEGRVRRVA